MPHNPYDSEPEEEEHFHPDFLNVMRVREDESIVMIHVYHAPGEPQDRENEDGPFPEDHAAYEALHSLWTYHRQMGWTLEELLKDLGDTEKHMKTCPNCNPKSGSAE